MTDDENYGSRPRFEPPSLTLLLRLLELLAANGEVRLTMTIQSRSGDE